MAKQAGREYHLVDRIGWLRAAVLGANDGILSTSSLILGVAAAGGTRASVLIAALAALVAGAMSMAAGEYVSVSSQHDTEQADLAREGPNWPQTFPANRKSSPGSIASAA
jgi:VIT1/CCC1 family predicted Fe2+/Mn2+ transporter